MNHIDLYLSEVIEIANLINRDDILTGPKEKK